MEHNIFPRVSCFTADRLRAMIAADTNFSSNRSNTVDSCSSKVLSYSLPEASRSPFYVSHIIIFLDQYHSALTTPNISVSFIFSFAGLMVFVVTGLYSPGVQHKLLKSARLARVVRGFHSHDTGSSRSPLRWALGLYVTLN